MVRRSEKLPDGHLRLEWQTGRQELRKRLIARATDPMDAIETRVAKAAEEMTYAPKFDKVLVNDDLQTAYREAESMVDAFLGA